MIPGGSYQSRKRLKVDAKKNVSDYNIFNLLLLTAVRVYNR